MRGSPSRAGQRLLTSTDPNPDPAPPRRPQRSRVGATCARHPAPRAPGVERRRRGEPGWGPQVARPARAPRGARGVRPAVPGTRPATAGDGRRASISCTARGAGERASGPRRDTHQKKRREQRLASCSGLGFTSVRTGCISPAGAHGRAAPGGACSRVREDAGAPAGRRAGPLGGRLAGGGFREPSAGPP